jgi:hypothetical protein
MQTIAERQTVADKETVNVNLTHVCSMAPSLAMVLALASDYSKPLNIMKLI